MRKLRIMQKKPPKPEEALWKKPWTFKHEPRANRKLGSLPKAISDSVRLFTGAKQGEMTESAVEKSIVMLRSLPDGSVERKRVTGFITRALLHHPKAQIRTNMAILFGEIGFGVPALKAALKNDPNIDVRGVSAYSLAHIGSPEVVPALKEMLCNSYDMVRMLSEDSYNRYGTCIKKGSGSAIEVAVPDKEVVSFFREELAKVWGPFP